MTELGLFIAIEGGDGSGKGTQAELLRKHASETLGMHVMKLSFPRYGEASAEIVGRFLDGRYGGIKDVHPELASLPYAIDRFAASSDVRNHLGQSGSLVIADRYVASNLAHQGSKIHDKEERRAFYDLISTIEYRILGIPKPSKQIVLLVPPDIAQLNVDKKDARSYTTKKRDIHEADANHLELAKMSYEELCRLYPEDYVAINCVDDNGNLRAIDDIQAEIRQIAGLI